MIKTIKTIIKITERLGNANFVARANPEAVQKEKERQIEYSEKVKALSERIKDLG